TASRASGTKDGLVRLPLDEIQPAPENDLVYRPIRLDDPDIQELARSIKKHGLREPIVVTRDGFILSGHRRYAACRVAGLRSVECGIEDIHRDSPDFETMLVEYNRQRVKGFDEVVREQIITYNPENAYVALIQDRKARSAISGAFLVIEGEK